MGDEGPRRHRGELFAALAAMGFGSAYVATSFALTAFEPVPAAAWRSLLAAVAVGAFVVARRRGGRAGATDDSEGGLSAGIDGGAWRFRPLPRPPSRMPPSGWSGCWCSPPLPVRCSWRR